MISMIIKYLFFYPLFAVRPRSLDPIYTVSYQTKWVKTSCTYIMQYERLPYETVVRNSYSDQFSIWVKVSVQNLKHENNLLLLFFLGLYLYPVYYVIFSVYLPPFTFFSIQQFYPIRI